MGSPQLRLWVRWVATSAKNPAAGTTAPRATTSSADALKAEGVYWALGGDNRFGSIFGATIGRLQEESGHKAEAVVQEGDEGHFVQGCVAVSTSDLATAVVALGAWIKTNVRAYTCRRFLRWRSDGVDGAQAR